jgi:hypothetical protein
MGAIPLISVQWGGVDYQCRLDFETIMLIESKVIISKLHNQCMKDEAQPTDIAWVVYCVLKSGGAQVQARDIWQANRDGEFGVDKILPILVALFGEVFGVGPDDASELDTEAGEKK